MKAEINNENKARFFALYWGQEVLQAQAWSSIQPINDLTLTVVNYWEKERKNYSYLSLKPLSSISDEDAIEVARIYGLKDVQCRALSQFGIKDLGIKHGEITLYNDLSMGGNSNCTFESDYFNKNIIFDYLRSKGYALPWMGLSVDEMVEAGWIKLVE